MSEPKIDRIGLYQSDSPSALMFGDDGVFVVVESWGEVLTQGKIPEFPTDFTEQSLYSFASVKRIEKQPFKRWIFRNDSTRPALIKNAIGITQTEYVLYTPFEEGYEWVDNTYRQGYYVPSPKGRYVEHFLFVAETHMLVGIENSVYACTYDLNSPHSLHMALGLLLCPFAEGFVLRTIFDNYSWLVQGSVK